MRKVGFLGVFGNNNDCAHNQTEYYIGIDGHLHTKNLRDGSDETGAPARLIAPDKIEMVITLDPAVHVKVIYQKVSGGFREMEAANEVRVLVRGGKVVATGKDTQLVARCPSGQKLEPLQVQVLMPTPPPPAVAQTVAPVAPLNELPRTLLSVTLGMTIAEAQKALGGTFRDASTDHSLYRSVGLFLDGFPIGELQCRSIIDATIESALRPQNIGSTRIPRFQVLESKIIGLGNQAMLYFTPSAGNIPSKLFRIEVAVGGVTQNEGLQQLFAKFGSPSVKVNDIFNTETQLRWNVKRNGDKNACTSPIYAWATVQGRGGMSVGVQDDEIRTQGFNEWGRALAATLPKPKL